MLQPANALTLADWRRRVSGLYQEVRNAAPADQAGTCHTFREARDQLFRDHPESPLAPEARSRFLGLAYYPYDPTWRLTGRVELEVDRETLRVELGADGELRFTRIARVRFSGPHGPAALGLFWIEGYGGGLFLPFRDRTNEAETFGGGRYLYDSIKGADLGSAEGSLVLDFNYAYNPSCAYDGRWVCPLSPAENTLPFAVTAGERWPR